MKREQGLDALRIIACIFVVGLHTLIPGQGMLNRILSILGTVCIPIFWMASGFGLGLKQEVTVKYAVKKITRILLVCFAWEFCHAMVMFVLKGTMRDFVRSFLLDFVQKGLFFHFWYMGTLIILYIMAPIVSKLANRNCLKWFVYGLLIMNLMIDVLTYIGISFFLRIPSSVRVWTYGLYFVLGYEAAKNKVKIKEYWNNMNKILLTAMSLLTVVLMEIWIVFVKDSVDAIRGYGDFHMSLPVIVATNILFFTVCFSDINGKWIRNLIGLVMGIYIVHPFVFPVLEKVVPIFTTGGSTWNVLLWLLTTVVSAVATFFIAKIPIIKEMVRL